MMLTTCVGTQAEETDNASDSNISVAPLETAETSGESETPVATEPEVSTESEPSTKAAESFNIEEALVNVTDGRIYANAETERDGVGDGNLVTPGTAWNSNTSFDMGVCCRSRFRAGFRKRQQESMLPFVVYSFTR